MSRIILKTLAISLIGLACVGAIAVMAWRNWPHHDAMDDWQVEDLVSHLHKRGFKVRIVPVMENGPVNSGVFLTTTDTPWTELNRRPIVAERINDWEGTVYCARIGPPPHGDGWLWQWGDCAERHGSLMFFGDAALRARIRKALREPPDDARSNSPNTLPPKLAAQVTQ
jgi:hypothetical protein